MKQKLKQRCLGIIASAMAVRRSNIPVPPLIIFTYSKGKVTVLNQNSSIPLTILNSSLRLRDLVI